MKNWILFAIALFSLAARSLAQVDVLRDGFLHPPVSSQPWVYWMWMDGNLSREGITADLEAMKRAHIGGAIVMEVNVGIPRGPVAFMSPAWRELFKHVVSEAERLGLEITLNAGPGWTGSGGPWVRPEQSMQHIVAADTALRGPRHFEGVLPRPARRPAFFGDGKLPPELEKAKDEFYRDVAVLAFPTPKDARRITDVDEKALFVRAPYSSQSGVKPFLSAVAGTLSAHAGGAIPVSKVIDLTDRLRPDGSLTWEVPSGDWTLLRFGRTSTGANTRPAPVPGVGLECDKLDRAALDAHFEAFIGTLLRDLGPRKGQTKAGWTMLHIDSWEMGAQNWTAAFREEFRSRRGYDPLPYLPATTGRVVESDEISERFLWDLRQTAQELLLENHAVYLKELAHRNGFGLSIEPYDMTPCADMSLGSLADVPMCEFWLYGFNTTYSVIEAASIAHTTGQPVVAAEAFTSSETEGWQAYPGSMKELGDWAFCAGVSRFVFHRYQHQPWLKWRPGMTMGPYGVHWERTQTWWDMSSAYHDYLSRCQFMLRKGLPVADVCYLVAEGAPQVFRPPFSALRGNPPDHSGYNFDGCAPEVFAERMSVRNGRLTLPDGMSYRVLVLPDRETITPNVLRKVRQLVEGGATVIGPRPRKSPGLSGFPACDREVKTIADELWGECDGQRVTEHRFGKGRIVWKQSTEPGADTMDDGKREPLRGKQYGDFEIAAGVLAAAGVFPDFESDAALRYIHRTEPGVDIYFVANPRDSQLTANCVFRVRGKLPELWDPVSLEIRSLPEFTVSGERTSLAVRLEPHQSLFFVFRKPLAGPNLAGSNIARLDSVAGLSGPWEVAFDPEWGGPGTISFERLEDWSQRPEEGVRFYSGTAVYRTVFDLPGEAAGVRARTGNVSRRMWLDLGRVQNLARVSLNGHDLGVLWCAPWRVEVTGHLKQKGNLLEIAVANLWPNRLIGDEQLPPDAEYGRTGNLEQWPDWLLKDEARPTPGRYTFTTWKHYTKESPLLSSGLLGPLRLLRLAQGGKK
jgi:hypothetical protein